MSLKLENYIPVVQYNGLTTAKTVDFSGSPSVSLPATITIASGATLAGAGTGANGIVLKNLKNSAASALSGTQLDITIDIGGTPYYFTVYPTKA